MSGPGRAPRVTACADAVLARTDFPGNPYFTALADGSMGREEFGRTQEQFYFAVAHFPRPMAGLLSRLPDPEQRLDILHNLVEEHGDFQASRFHANTFRQFLCSVGARGDDVRGLRPWPAVRAFNAVVSAACQLEEVEVGVGCMGVIEYAFAGISAAIGRAVVRRGWVPEDGLVHYRLHAEIDRRHAEEFFAVVEPGWDDRRRRGLIIEGLELGAHAFDRLYRELALAATAPPGDRKA